MQDHEMQDKDPVPLAQLRFVLRGDPLSIDRRILQQKWRTFRTCKCGCGITQTGWEWRDVPLEE